MSSAATKKRPAPRRPRRSHTKAVVVAVVCLLSAAVVVLPIAKLVGQIDRISGVFDGQDRAAPSSQAAAGGLDVLVVGVTPSDDTRPTSWLPEGRQAASIMLMHVDADRQGVTIVGIPLDVEVKVYGDGTRSLGSVPDMGEPAQLVGTVEKLAGIRIDHLAVLDWRAFSTMIDRMGGVDVSTTGGNGAVSVGGIRMQVTGEDALKVVMPQPKVDSVALTRSQLGLMDAVVDGSLHQPLHKSPLLVYNFLDSLTENLAVDKGWSTASMARLFLSVWKLQPGDMKYVTVPVTCVKTGNGCRPRLDERAAPEFWSGVEQDRTSGWLARNNNRGLVESSP